MSRDKFLKLSNKHLFYLLTALVLIFLIAARTPLDGDMWWHLRSGQLTLENHSVLLKDLFSFSRYGESWINHSWLGQVILYGFYDLLGYSGLSLCVTLAATSGIFFIWLQSGGASLLNILFLLLGGMAASTVWSPRPQIFSLLCFSICSYILYLYRQKGFRKLWVLAPLFVLWSNLHGGYPLGLMLMGLVFAGMFLNRYLGKGTGNPQNLESRLLLWIGICFLVVLVNPNGLNTWKIPFQTLDVSILQELISEWASPDFHQPITWLFLILLFAGFFFLALSEKEKDYVDILLFICFAWMALMARRNIGPFVYICVPIICKYAGGYFEQISGQLKNIPGISRLGQAFPAERESDSKPGKLNKWINLGFVGLLALTALLKLYGVSHPVLVSHYEDQLYPKEAVNWLADHGQAGNILNEYNWGGYLIWRLPDFAVFVDGRTDLFGDEVIGEWLAFVRSENETVEFLETWPVDYVMLSPERAVISGLEDLGWEKIYTDEQAVILKR